MIAWRSLRQLPLLALAASLANAPAAAQVVTDIVPDTLAGRDLGTSVSTIGSVTTIDGGTIAGPNLFHSFESFSLAQAETANWVPTTGNPSSIANVINRITGGRTSFLLGTIDSTAIPNAAFWFINPSGVVFGAGAQVNVPAAAHFSTAGALRFSDGQSFRISTPQGSSLSVASPTAFGFLGGESDIRFVQTGPIGTQGTLSLTAANVRLENSQLATSGLSVAAVGTAAADVTPDGNSNGPFTGSVQVLAGSELKTAVSGTTVGGNLAIRTGTLEVSGGSQLIAASAAAGGGTLRVDATNSATFVSGFIIANADVNLASLGSLSLFGTTVAAGNDANLKGDTAIEFRGGSLVANANVTAFSKGRIDLASLIMRSGADTALTAGTTLDVTSVTAGTSLALMAGDDLTLGTGGAGTTASLTTIAGDILITSKLVAAGTIALTSGDDVLIANYDQASDTGLIRSTGRDVSIHAQGSVYGIGGTENALPTAQRRVAALSTTGNLTINSDGDARFDSLTASGSLTLAIAGSLTGSPLTGGAATGTNVAGGAIFAQGTGGDVTIRSGLAGSPVVDVVVLNRVLADRDITINGDQLAIGTLSTNSGTITLNDTSGGALSADNYYVGLLSGAGDLNVFLTGQPTAAIPLIAADAAGAPEFFDSAFGKTDLTAGSSITGSIGRAAQLGDVSFATVLDLDSGALVADTLRSTDGSADILASIGTLAILDTRLGGSLMLTKQGGSAATASDELRLRGATVGGGAMLSSSTSIRVGALSAGGDALIDAEGDLVLATVDSGGSIVGRVGNAILLGTTAAGEDVALKSNTGTITLADTTTAGDDVLLTAAGAIATGAVTASGTGPDTRTVTFGAGALDAAFAAETNSGGDIVATSIGASFTGNGALTAASDVTVTSSTSTALLSTTTASTGNVTVNAGSSAQLVGDVASGANTSVTAGTTATIQQNMTAGGNYSVTGGTGVTLGDASARTQAAGGAVTITATTGDVPQGSGRLTVVSNSDTTGAEQLTISANGGSIVLANSQLTGGSIAGRESDVVVSAGGTVTADDLDGDRVALSAGGNTVADTIEAGTGAADLGDLAQRQSIDLIVTGGSVMVNTAQAFGEGHDIDIRAANALTAVTLTAGGNLVGRTGAAIMIGGASAGDDVALKSNTATLTITGAATAGGDVLLTAPGAIAVNVVTASGAGPDARTVTFGGGALGAAYAAETNPGADIVINSTEANVIARGALAAASDVTVTANTSAALLSTTASTGNVGVTAGTSAQLVGAFVSGANTTVTAGTTASITESSLVAGSSGGSGAINLSGRNSLSVSKTSITTIASAGGDAGAISLSSAIGELNLKDSNLTSIGNLAGQIDLLGVDVILTDTTFNTATFAATGDNLAGVIGIKGLRTLELTNTIIDSDTRGAGNAGGVLLVGPDGVGAKALKITGGRISSDAIASGNAGLISVSAQTIRTDGARLTSNASGQGNAGSVNLKAQAVELAGGTIVSSDSAVSGINGFISIAADTLVVDRSTVSAIAANGNRASGTHGLIQIKGRNTTSANEVELRNGASISTNTNGAGDGGDIEIASRRVQVSDSSLQSRSIGCAGVGCVSGGKAGDVTILGDIISITGSNPLNPTRITTNTETSGAAGRVTLGGLGSAASTLTIGGSATEISSQTSGGGNAGKIRLTSSGVTIGEGARISTSTTLAATGNAGVLDLTVAGDLTLDRQARLSSDALGNGKSGDVTVIVGGTLNLAGVISADVSGKADAGNVTVRATNLNIKGGRITSDTLAGSSGKAGDIAVEVTEALSVDAQGRISSDALGNGDSGNVKVMTGGRLSLLGGVISADVSGVGNADNVQVIADMLDVQGGRITSNTLAGSTGKAGSVTVKVRLAGLDLAGSIASASAGAGEGGVVSVTATEALGLSNSSFIAANVAGAGKGGDVTVRAPQITLSNLSFIASNGIAGSSGNAGNVLLESAQVRLGGGSFVSSDTAAGSMGNAGNVSIVGTSLDLHEKSFISSNALGGGNGGNVILTSTALLTIGGGSSVSTDVAGSGTGGQIRISAPVLTLNGASLISSDALEKATGNAGGIDIRTDDFTLSESSSISSDALGQGKGGIVDVRATRFLKLTTGSFISTNVAGRGDGGQIKVQAPVLILSDNSLIASDALSGSIGNAGDVGITVGDVRLSGSSLISSSVGRDGGGNAGNVTVAADMISLDRSTIASNASSGSLGDAGNIAISASSIALRGGNITSNALGAGDGGIVKIAATTKLGLDELSVISTNVFGAGSGGQVQLNAPTVALDGRSSISSNAFGSTGNAGGVSIAANDLLLINRSSIGSDVGGVSSGDAGNVTVNASRVVLSGASSITSKTAQGSIGNAGNVTVVADTVDLESSSAIASDASGQGNGGAVSIDASNTLTLAAGASVSSDTFGAGNGGGVKLRADELRLNDASISANGLATGKAGSIAIVSKSLTLNNAAIRSQSNVQQGGLIDIGVAGPLTLSNSSIKTDSIGPGDAGSIKVRATSLTIAAASSISSDAAASSTGRSGSVDVAVDRLISLSEAASISTSSANSRAAGNIAISAGNIRIDGSGSSDPGGNARVTSSNMGTGDAGEIAIVQTGEGQSSGITLTEGALVTTNSARANAGRITIDMGAGSILSLSGESVNARIDTSGLGGGQVVIGANGAPYIVLLNGGDITALGNTDRAVLNISANFLIRTADRLNQIAIGQGEEVGLEFEDVSSGTVTTTLEVLDASRVLAGACPAARNSGEFSQLAAPAVGPYAIAPLGRVPSPAKINLSATAAEQGTSTGWRACR